MTFLTNLCTTKYIEQQKFQLPIYHMLAQSLHCQKNCSATKISITNLEHNLGKSLDYQEIVQKQRKISINNLWHTWPISALPKKIPYLNHQFITSLANLCTTHAQTKNWATKILITNSSHNSPISALPKNIFSNKDFNNQIRTYLANLWTTNRLSKSKERSQLTIYVILRQSLRYLKGFLQQQKSQSLMHHILGQSLHYFPKT